MQLALRVSLFLIMLTSIGCTTVRVDQLRNTDSSIDRLTDHVVILGRNESAEFETEPELITCIGDRISRGSQGINVVPPQQFIDDLYPWFEPRTAPLQPERLRTFLQEPLIQEKIESHDIRYFIWISGDTDTIDSSGSLSCGITAGAAGCFGFSSWEQQGVYEATIWDFDDLQEAGRISTDAQGTSYLPAIVIPIPLLARVQANACESMGEQIQQFFVSEQAG